MTIRQFTSWATLERADPETLVNKLREVESRLESGQWNQLRGILSWAAPTQEMLQAAFFLLSVRSIGKYRTVTRQLPEAHQRPEAALTNVLQLQQDFIFPQMLQGENVPANLAQLQCFVQDKGEETLKFYVVFLLGFLSALQGGTGSSFMTAANAKNIILGLSTVLLKIWLFFGWPAFAESAIDVRLRLSAHDQDVLTQHFLASGIQSMAIVFVPCLLEVLVVLVEAVFAVRANDPKAGEIVTVDLSNLAAFILMVQLDLTWQQNRFVFQTCLSRSKLIAQHTSQKHDQGKRDVWFRLDLTEDNWNRVNERQHDVALLASTVPESVLAGRKLRYPNNLRDWTLDFGYRRELMAAEPLPTLEFQAELCVPCGNRLGECPLWDDLCQKLCWIDIQGKSFWQHDPLGTRGNAKCFDLPSRPGSFCLTMAHGAYIIALESGFSLFDSTKEQLIPITEDLEPGLRTRLNDGRVDCQGRFVVSGCVDKGDEPISAVYRLNTDLTVEKLLADVRCGNSICFSEDSMFFADPAFRGTDPEQTGTANTIWRFFEYASTGMAGPSQVFVNAAGRPDGSVIDAEGCLWNAEFGGGRVVRYLPDGSESMVVRCPVRYTTCATFGGSDLQTMYITDASVFVNQRVSKKRREELPEGYAGGIFSVRLPTRGLAERRFAGSIPRAQLQRQLVDSAWKALKPAGVLIYSTCTLNRMENEEVCDYLLSRGAQPLRMADLTGIDSPGAGVRQDQEEHVLRAADGHADPPKRICK
ncbi:L-arabinolactonase [Symbiodinium microadriaticum]|uniref:L-arabinolactonase n=1 Tax=Symbiodinium microadriaticum TaxID=2951 RepID=A0A1Q9EE75_SYMMI|nr:L-arabinolactonase [Symbiodinium microadriaticum]